LSKASPKIARVLTIAGSDSGGGAGIQADIKTIAALGGYAMTAITAVTVQDTRGVQAVHPVPDDIVLGQIRAVLDDIGADSIKTGMLPSASLIKALADLLSERDELPALIVDPVLVATSGDSLADDDAIAAYNEYLVPLATLITPNIPEAEALTGGQVEDLETQLAAAEALVDMGASAALVKGGHLTGTTMRDILVSDQGMNIMERPRIETRHTHGTGCTLASAIATLVAGGQDLSEAVQIAGDYLHEAIQAAPGLGKGSGPVDHMWAYRDS
jgi:hydroxymethylpyrimidine/phosphomethylpyrimidine kinase